MTTYGLYFHDVTAINCLNNEFYYNSDKNPHYPEYIALYHRCKDNFCDNSDYTYQVCLLCINYQNQCQTSHHVCYYSTTLRNLVKQ